MFITSIIVPLVVILFSVKPSLSKLINLPAGVRAEGIAHAAGSNYVAADFATGTIYLIDVASELITTAVRPPTPRIGVGLFVTKKYIVNAGAGPTRGAPTAGLHVYDVVTGQEAASCSVDDGVFVNDVVADSEYAYYTDSGRPYVYRLSLQSLPMCQVDMIQLPPPFSGEGFRANGIIKFRGGLVVANRELGSLFFIDLLRKNRASRLTPNDAVLYADGLDIAYRNSQSFLYVAQNRLNLITEWSISMSGDRKVSVKKRRDFSRPNIFRTPTTVAVSGHTVVVANFNFEAPENTTELFSIATFRI